MKVFDAHCHLQDPRIVKVAPKLIETAVKAGVVGFVVNGISENDWNLVNQMAQSYPSIVPCFGLHPWYVAERTPNWFNTLKNLFDVTPSAAVGEMLILEKSNCVRVFFPTGFDAFLGYISKLWERSLYLYTEVQKIGLDKGSRGKQIDFTDQVEVFQSQIELAKELERPASVHCVRAYGDLLQIMQRIGPFPAGVILHSYLGSAEMVPEFAKLGAYFSFSGFLMSMKVQKAKKMLKMVPSERILLETDAPDALPKSPLESLYLVEEDSSESNPKESHAPEGTSGLNEDASTMPKETLNHPANILYVLDYVASLLEMTKEEVAELSYQNAVRLFSYRDQS